jgi:carbonic anhydrase
MISAREALKRLREGNSRFAGDLRSLDSLATRRRRRESIAGQEPFAIILGCSDSRVPAEIVFDQGLGDLFVIRVAGNIVAPSQVGSVEFAAARFGTRLVVVLGHSRCGAILATLEELSRPSEDQSRNLRSIVDRIRPSVEGLLTTGLEDQPDALVERAVRANIRASVNHLRHGSDVLEQLILRRTSGWSEPSTRSRPGSWNSSTDFRRATDPPLSEEESMRQSSLPASLILGVALILAGRPGHADEVRDAVEAGNRAFIAAFLRGDAAAIAQLYTEDAQVIAPGEPVARGRSAIAAAWQKSIDSGVKDVALHTTEVESTGDLASETGDVRLVAKDGSITQGRYLVVWKREGGRWKLHRDIWNSEH